MCDEAHNIKDIQSKASISVQWLKATFHILATAISISNGINDWLGYMPFIEVSDTLWEPRQDIDLDTLDPFALEDNDPFAVLRYTQEAVRRFILPRNITSVLQGSRLNTI